MTKSIYCTLLLALTVTGAVMIYCSLSYPWYTVSDEELAGVARRIESKPRNERFREWYVERAKLATPRKMLRAYLLIKSFKPDKLNRFD